MTIICKECGRNAIVIPEWTDNFDYLAKEGWAIDICPECLERMRKEQEERDRERDTDS